MRILSVVLIMDLLKDWQACRYRLIFFNESRLVLAAGVEALKGIQVWCIIVPVELEHGSMFMPKHAVRAIVAVKRLVVGATVVVLEFVGVAHDCAGGELLLRVGEPALVLEATLGRLDPVAAKLVLLATSRQWHDRAIVDLATGGAEEVVFVRNADGAAQPLTLLGAALEDVLVTAQMIVVHHGWDEVFDLLERELRRWLRTERRGATWSERWRRGSHGHRRRLRFRRCQYRRLLADHRELIVISGRELLGCLLDLAGIDWLPERFGLGASRAEFAL